MSSIFISHSSSDDPLARELVAFLESAGHQSYFLDFDPAKGIPAGRNWEQELYAHLRKCQIVIIIYSRNFAASLWCFAEVTHARALGKYIIVLKFDDGPVDNLLSDIQHIDASVGFSTDVAVYLENGLFAAGINKEQWDSTRAPYPGLLSFEEKDAPVFFGRNEEREDLLKKIRQRRSFGGPQLLMVLGASGSGKSSLIKAGVIPVLRRQPNSWIIIGPLRPSKKIFEELSRTITKAYSQFKEDRDWKAIHEQLLRDASDKSNPGSAFADILRQLGELSGEGNIFILIFIDQFEELLDVDVAQTFSSYLSCCIQRMGKNCIVIGTLRSDFLGLLQKDQHFKDLVFDDHIVHPVNDHAILAAIKGPAEIAGVELEEGLAEMLLRATTSADALPLLAFVLRELWEESAGNGKLTVAAYKHIGGIEGAVSAAAEAILKTGLSGKMLDIELERRLKSAFREMVRIDEEGRYTKRPASWSILPREIDSLLMRFVSSRLLIRSGDGAEIKVEVAHEAIFRNWDRMVRWLEEDRAFLTWRKRLDLFLEEWRANGETDALLLKGTLLQEANEWIKAVETGQYYLSDTEKEYISHSDRQNKSEQQLESARKQKEIRTLRMLFGTAMVTVILVSIFGYWIFRNNIETNDRLARNYWELSHKVREGDPLSSVYYTAGAIGISRKDDLSKNLYLDIQPFLPQAFLENIIKLPAIAN